MSIEEEAHSMIELAVEERPTLAAGSLRERMHARSEELSKRTTELFPVPLYDDFVAVELRVLPWTSSQEAIERNQRSQKLAMLYAAGDEIVKATVAFWEIGENGIVDEENGLLEDVSSWREVATKLAGKSLPDFAGERVALIAMCSDQGVIALNASFRRWLGGARVGLRQELAADF